MKKRVTLIAIAVLLLLAAFLAIMTRMHSPEEALAPPNPNGELRQLQQAFENAVGSGTQYKLQYPEEGDYRSAYVLYDVDGDEEQEALAFYTKNEDESSVRMNLLDLQDDRWVSVLDESGYGSKIDSVNFADLDGDGMQELLLAWSLQGADSSRTLTVQSVDWKSNGKMSLKSLANMPYKAMQVYDMDNDGNEELLVLWSETRAKVLHNYAGVMKLTGGVLSRYGSDVELDSSASVYDKIVLQKGKTPIAFVDARTGDSTMFTEVLWWDGVNKTLRAPFTTGGDNSNLSTLRYDELLTSDIDNDGIYEIPIAYTGSGSSATARDGETEVSLTVWSVTGTAEPGELQSKAYSIVDTQNKFILYLSAGYRDSVVAFRNTENGVITVYELDDNGSRGKPFFRLYCGTEKPSADHTFLAEKDGRFVYGTLTEEGRAYGFTDKTIQDNIVFY